MEEESIEYKKRKNTDNYVLQKDSEIVHFGNIVDCDLFVEFMNSNFEKNIVGNRCCSGIGVEIYLDAEIACEYESIFRKTILQERRVEVIIDECKICFVEKPLIRNCNLCKHPFCRDCLQLYSKNACPYCRNVTPEVY
jgi:hypothetical protein